MADYRLVALDLDGTLTDSDKNIPQANFDALMRIQRKGVKLVLASGRPKFGIQKLAEQLQLSQYGGYIMAYNGALVVECSTNCVVSATTLPREALPKLCRTAKNLNVSILTYDAPADLILTETSGDKWIEHEAWLNNRMTIKIVDDLDKAAPADLPKCLMVGEPERMAEVEPMVRDAFPQLNVYRSSPFFLEIVAKGIDKAKTMECLVGLLGLTRDNVMAFGDGYNDIGMVDYAGMGVAMENGCDEIKKIANFITKSNDDSGVAYAIEKFF